MHIRGQYLILVMTDREGFLREVGLKNGIIGKGRGDWQDRQVVRHCV